MNFGESSTAKNKHEHDKFKDNTHKRSNYLVNAIEA